MAGGTKTHAALRLDWLARHHEEAIDPHRPLVDAHIHLYDRPEGRYLLADLAEDIARSGHNITASVYVQARSMYHIEGPEAFKPVGETEFAQSAALAGIVSYADLTLGEEVGAVLDAHSAASPRFCGIRRPLAWDGDAALMNPSYRTSYDTMASTTFRAGFAQLSARGLSFDAWIFFAQLPDLAALARDFPEVPIILNHCGGILGIGAYAGRQDEVYRLWHKGLRDLAALPNVHVKLGGLGMKMCGFGLDDRPHPANSAELAALWQPYIGEAISLFGANRCLFESNFPVDKGSMSYGTCWNAFKLLTVGASETEKTLLYSDVAKRLYRLDGPK